MWEATPPDLAGAARAMDDFAARTGITSQEPPRRYLWTDAFAVCNWLGLHQETGEGRFLELARSLVTRVHRILGRHREDDPRTGWISGLSEEEGARRPTAGGLRIGKPRNERGPDERYDPRGEWDRDGQYYHYLTKWMWALTRMWRVTGDATYHGQAVDLARAAHDGFMERQDGHRRLVWKMSIDLSRALVPSSGHHDPLDGLVTTALVSSVGPSSDVDGSLAEEIGELEDLCGGRSWVTEDPLGAGGLLVAALRCAQLRERDHPVGQRHLRTVRDDAETSLRALARGSFLRQPVEMRLAFRELGLAIGIQARARLDSGADGPTAASDPEGSGANPEGRPSGDGTRGLTSARLARRIVELWSRPESRRSPTWTDHLDISQVMWATARHPRGFLAV